MRLEFKTEPYGKRGKLQITHLGSGEGASFARDSITVELATKTAASQFSRWLLRVEGEADPVEKPICGKFGKFPKTKSNACIFSPCNGSAVHLRPIISPFVKISIVN